MRRTKASKSTILRVLNGDAKGNYARVAKRHEEIRRIADELNYRPSYAGRTIARKRTQTIGLLYPKEEPKLSRLYAQTVHHLATTLSDHGYDLALHAIDTSKVKRTDLLLDRRYDGYVVHDRVPGSMIEATRRASLPCVAINTEPCEGMFSVRADDHGGMTQLLAHLMELGHRRMAWVRPMPLEPGHVPHASMAVREHAYEQVMLQADLEPIIFNGPCEALNQLSAIRPTVLIAHKSSIASELITRLDEAFGLLVPGDVSVAAFDDNELAAQFRPPMTVMRVPFDLFGQRAARMIIQAIEGANPEDVVLPLTLIRRQSVATPNRTNG